MVGWVAEEHVPAVLGAGAGRAEPGFLKLGDALPPEAREELRKKLAR